MQNDTSSTLVERLQAYCQAKPGVLFGSGYGLQGPSYYVHARYYFDRADYFVQFLINEDPIRLELRCRVSDLESPQQPLPLHVSERTAPSTANWRWVFVNLDAAIPDSVYMRLVDESYDICFADLPNDEKRLIQMAERKISLSDALDALIDMHALSDRRDEIEVLLQPAIGLQTYPLEDNALALGQSHIGGEPDLPADWRFPTFDSRPLAFLAQVNLAEIPDEIDRGPLPPDGILYFFSGYGWVAEESDYDVPWHRIEEDGFSQVLYFDGPFDDLKRQPAPEGIMTFKAASVRFMQEHALPSVDHNVRDQILSDVDWDEYEFEAFAALDFDLRTFRHLMHRPTSGHKLLGYADLIQPTVMEPGTRLLCQINSDDHCDMMWADGGTIYFNILYADLEAHDFSRIYSELQSG